MEKFDFMDDPFWRGNLGKSGTAPKIPNKKFEKNITFVVKLKHCDPEHKYTVYRRLAPEWAKDIVSNMLDNDNNVDRYFIEEENGQFIQRKAK